MMQCVGTPPEIVGCQSQHANDTSDPIIREAMTEERAVAAIMLDHEEANEEARRRYGEKQADPVAGVQHGPHQNPHRYESHRRYCQFKYAARAARLPVRGEAPHQRGGIWHDVSIQISFLEKGLARLLLLPAALARTDSRSR